jgi:hypothetical protein
VSTFICLTFHFFKFLAISHRFTTGFVHILKHHGTRKASALLACYYHHLTSTMPTDTLGYNGLTDGEIAACHLFNPLSEQLQKLDTDTEELLRSRILFALYTQQLHNKPYLVESSDIKTIELGVARYMTPDKRSEGSIVIDGPSVIASALVHFQRSAGSIEQTLLHGICSLPNGSVRGHNLESIGVFLLAQQLDGTRSLG